MQDVQQNNLEGIAVVGMSGRFPGASNLDQFWYNLKNGVESISFFSEQELLAAGVAPELLAHPHYVPARGVLADADQFDAHFFGFNPREAELLDPQQRLFLECAWEALEHAGYDPQRYPGIIGVFGSVSLSTYAMRNIYTNPDLVAAIGDYQILLSSDKDFIAERVSYKLNLRGPSMSVQTACSSALVAVHMACRSLLMGESDMVLAGGAAISVPQQVGYLYQEGGIMSPDGHCRAFDHRAQGTVRGDGAGIVVLKRLEDAIDDGDTVYAVIRGSAVNNDGAFKVGFTAPAIDGQAEVIGLALELADVDPDTISYIEAHGTGTPLGDPIELAALTQVFRQYTERKQFCAIGSVKTNLGHLDAAAGIAGLIKTVLALKHGAIPPSLHFEQPNPTIDFANSPFAVQRMLTPWPDTDHPRRAGVSSFGIGGTNVHVVLEEAPIATPAATVRPWHVIPLSAHSTTALDRATENLALALQHQPEQQLADVSYTLQVGRRAFAQRRVLLCRDHADLQAVLAQGTHSQQWTAHCPAQNRPVAFLFPGQGAQYVQMGAGIYQHEPLVREIVDECSHVLRPHLDGRDLRRLLFPPQDQEDEAQHLLTQTRYTQPALFVIEYALARLWQAWGISPAAMIGHSLGEYVAGCLAGVFTLPDALRLVAVRGRLMQAMEPGAMLSVPLTEEQIQPFLGSQVALAAVNAPGLSVLSGPCDAIAAVEARLQQEGVETQRLHTSHAFHSVMMKPLLPEFRAAVATIPLQPPQIPYLSNITGTWITADEATDPDYWVQHVCSTVRFGPGVATLLAQADMVLLEVGPGRTLNTLVRRQGVAAHGRQLINVLRHPQNAATAGLASDEAMLMQALGRLWLAGVTVDWEALWAGQRRQRVPLPGYPFERERYWIEPLADSRSLVTTGASPAGLHKQPDLTHWFYTPVWKQSFFTNLTASAAANNQEQRWLLYASSMPLVEQLVEQACTAGYDLCCVYAADSFAQRDPHHYTINPQQPEQYVTLLHSLRANNWLPDKIIYSWQLSTNSHSSTNGVSDRSTPDSFDSLLMLVQALAQTDWSDPLQIVVLTSSQHQVTGNEIVQPDGALLHGLCTVVPQEYPHLTCTSIDIVPPTQINRQHQLLRALLAEIAAEPAPTPVAYRHTQRWSQTYEAYPIPPGTGSSLRDGGVYLILGGLGGIGLTLAEHLAHTRRAALALVGRSALPARETWADWLAAHPEPDATSQKIQAIQRMEQHGSTVLVFRADVANLEHMQDVVTQVCNRFGTLHGVIHAAGITGERSFEMLQETNHDSCALQFQAKRTGLIVLEQVLGTRPLDFCLLISSLASVLGGRGLAIYTAASQFMDAFAHRHNQHHPVPWLSVNWDNWRVLADDAAENLAESGGFAELARLAMTRQEGLDVVERLLAADRLAERCTQVIISTADLPARIAHLAARDQQQEQRMRSGDNTTLHKRPELQTSYVPPTSAAEQQLVDIWQGLLGIAPIGINDNFFELGGDSLISIQVIARARAVDIEFTPKQLFEYPTIASLVAVAGTAPVIAINQAPGIGEVPLTPVQHWFFEQDMPERHHWNQAILCATAQPLNLANLEEVMHHLLHHHDALRMRFVPENSGWRQFYAKAETATLVEWIDMTSIPASQHTRTIETVAARYQSSLSLSAGPLVRLLAFADGDGPGHLLFIIHHLVVDAVSWRILLEDFQTAYQQHSQGSAITLPARTTAFQYWSTRLTTYAQSPELERELPFWSEPLRTQAQPLPRDYFAGINSVASLRSVTVALSGDKTQALLHQVPQAYRTDINDVLLTTLALAFRQWSGSPLLLIDLEGHGREALFDDVDLSRTVGWFTAVYPVVLDLTSIDELGTALQSVKEQLRRIPHRGIGYGLLRYLCQHDQIRQELQNVPPAEISFLYLGQFDQVHPGDAFLQILPNPTIPTRHPEGVRRHLLEISAHVQHGQFEMEWRYSANVHQQTTIATLAGYFIDTLTMLIKHCLSPAAGDSAPADFPLAGLSRQQLSQVSHLLEQIDDLDLSEEIDS